jgi:tetratricopeptide (TPR) repeat protein
MTPPEERSEPTRAARARMLVAQGQQILSSGNLDGAAAALREACELDPSVAFYRDEYAGVLIALGRYDEAKALLLPLAADESYRDAANVQGRLGVIHSRQGELEAAHRALSRAIALDPNVEWYRNALADVLERQGQVDEALAMFRALETSATRTLRSTAHARVATILARRGDAAGAEEEFRKSITAHRNVAWVHRALGNLLEQQNRTVEAVEALENAERLQPEHGATRKRLAALRKQLPVARTGDPVTEMRPPETGANSTPAAIRAESWLDSIRRRFLGRR